MSTPVIVYVQVFLFIFGSFALIYVSRKPLRVVGSHGFYRFFAWEAILALAALNLPVWFSDPFSLPQVLSWLLLLVSAFLVIHGVALLRVIGKSGQRQALAASTLAANASEANYTFENTAHLVRVGAYRWIRHPLYASLLYLAWGVFFKQWVSLPGLALALLASVFLWLTARADETECKRFFGNEYLEYMQQTRMFIPFLF
jgi:protein-S-isoprenylcysteine O-methyltransferase Ste14